MIKIKCQDCHNQIQNNSLTSRKVSISDHYIYCKKCLRSKEVCSLSKSKKIFLLGDDDFKKLKTIYICNPKNKNKFFIFSDVKKIVIQKYGSIENLQNIKNNKEYEKKLKNINKNKKIENRKKLLIEELRNNKLEFKNHGDCYSFVK